MRFIINNRPKENVANLIRNIGYRFLDENRETNELNLVRPINMSDYPRFHIYLKIEKENLIFNMHLDQKRPIYKGTPAHSGEHKGLVVEAETERIKSVLK